MDRRHGEPVEVKPLDVDGVRTVAIITVLWAVAFVVLATQRTDLDDAGRGWWIWTCLAGVGLGLLGLEYCRKRRDAILRAELEAEADSGFDDVGDWADGELAELAADNQSEADFDQPPVQHPMEDAVPPAADQPRHDRQQPPPPRMADQSTRPYGAGGRPPPGYVTGDFPIVPPSGEPRPRAEPSTPIPPARPRPEPSTPAPPPRATHDDPLYGGPGQPAAPAGYSPEPDRARRHPRDEELARRFQEEQARARESGQRPPAPPEFLTDEPASGEHAHSSGEFGQVEPAAGDLGHATPAEPDEPLWSPQAAEPPPARRETLGFESEFFSPEPVQEPPRGPEFLLDEDDEDSPTARPARRDSGDDDVGGEYRGRRARRD